MLLTRVEANYEANDSIDWSEFNRVVRGEAAGAVGGDTVVVAAVAVSIISGGAFLANERWIIICLDRLSLSFIENLQARIASGTDDRGHRNK